MKILYTIPFYLVLLLGCNTQKQVVENDKFCDFDQTISENEKTFDLRTLSSSITDTLDKYHQVEIFNDNEYLIKLFKNQNIDTLISKTIFNKKTNIIKTLFYNKNDGKLGISDFTYHYSDLPIGKAKYYNKSGEVIKIEDDNQSDKYPICFKQAMAIVENRIAKKDTIFAIEREKKSIKKEEPPYYWQVYVDEINNKPSRTIWIYKVDGVTGKILKKIRSIPSITH